MNTPKHILEKLNRLYSNVFLGAGEIRILEKWLNQIESDTQLEKWLFANWENSENVVVDDITFDDIRRRIEQYDLRSKTHQYKRLISLIQKIAAILIVPLLVLSIWLLINRQPAPVNVSLATAKGERTHVYLPDGSEVWLNVDSKLEYSTNYMAANRSLKLTGEAFFKVAKGEKFPFTVNTVDLQVKATGTEFSISSYDGESRASAYLKEGTVEFHYAPKSKKKEVFNMTPGEKVTINRITESIKLARVNSTNSISWINGELLFENEPMNEVFEKMERWYNVKIEYSPDDFANETLKVKLKKGEPIDRLIQIIDQAIGIKVKQADNEYVINRR